MKKFILLNIMIISTIIGISQNLKIKSDIIDAKGNYIESKVFLYEGDSLILQKETSSFNYKLDLNKEYFLVIESISNPSLTKIVNFNTIKAKSAKHKFEFVVMMDESLKSFGGLVYYSTNKDCFDYIILK